MRFRPRHVVFLHAVLLAGLASLAVWLNWSASRRSSRELRATTDERIAALETTIADLRDRLSATVSTNVASALVSTPAVSRVARPAGPPPRLLGRGCLGSSLVYWDVRDWSGDVRRYYAHRTPDDVSRVLRMIAADIRDSEYYVTRVAAD